MDTRACAASHDDSGHHRSQPEGHDSSPFDPTYTLAEREAAGRRLLELFPAYLYSGHHWTDAMDVLLQQRRLLLDDHPDAERRKGRPRSAVSLPFDLLG